MFEKETPAALTKSFYAISVIDVIQMICTICPYYCLQQITDFHVITTGGMSVLWTGIYLVRDNDRHFFYASARPSHSCERTISGIFKRESLQICQNSMKLWPYQLSDFTQYLRKALREFLQCWHKCGLGSEVKLIRFLWSQVGPIKLIEDVYEASMF